MGLELKFRHSISKRFSITAIGHTYMPSMTGDLWLEAICQKRTFSLNIDNKLNMSRECGAEGLDLSWVALACYQTCVKSFFSSTLVTPGVQCRILAPHFQKNMNRLEQLQRCVVTKLIEGFEVRLHKDRLEELEMFLWRNTNGDRMFISVFPCHKN